eukprot:TRINITY_DN28759_c0_g1_i1.p1 TRINITY_DN28759_c0_g1~~TRINITY_DN28759_c0_g1_i1.p1  ORF type:complete len:1084 (+),score=219.53 TRINITY_DN28759_c0_g1_i1:78-3329(+)
MVALAANDTIVSFPIERGEMPVLGHVGGKGLSLMRMSSVPIATVPNGFVLTTTFFEAWFEALKQQPHWRQMLDACQGYVSDDQIRIAALRTACNANKEACTALQLDLAQRQSIVEALDKMAHSSQGDIRFVAVRSSSPEEDLAGMSFAGGYETVLGVCATVENVQIAVQTVFASCLDERVFVYKISHGIEDLTPRIAVVVQRQVAASVAGVAFSLDPISNCYDWAMINTNFGLGETVVGGQCSPDYYLGNKVTKAVIRKELGKKEIAVWLGDDGGVHERRGDSSKFTLSDEEVAMVITQLSALEKFYGHPIDTEFALDENRQLMWLQARPITTHLTLPPELTTQPGEPEVLWLDVMQIVQGFTDRISTLGLSMVRTVIMECVLGEMLGMNLENAKCHNRPFMAVPETGMLYFNGSFILRHIGWSRKESWASKIELMDFNVAKLIRELEDKDFLNSVSLRPIPLMLAWHSPGLLCNLWKSGRDLERQAERAKDAHAGTWCLIRDFFEMLGMNLENAKCHNRPFMAVPETGMLYFNGSFILRHIGWSRKESWASKIELMDFNVAKLIRELEDKDFLNSVSLRPIPLMLAWHSPGLLCNLWKSGRDLERQAERAKDAHAGTWCLIRDFFEMRGYGELCSARGAFQDREKPVLARERFAGNIDFSPTADLIAAYCRQQGFAEGVEMHVLDLIRAVKGIFFRNIVYGLVAATASGGFGMKNIREAFETAPPEVKALVDDVTCGCGFVTTVLSELLEEIAEALEEAGGSFDFETLQVCMKDGAGLPEKAWTVWKLVIDCFGHRGVGELDASTVRYREDPTMLLEQIVTFMKMERSARPRQIAAAALQKRDAAVETLSKWLSENGGDPVDFNHQVKRYHMHFCHRETPKYLIVKLLELVRLEVLKQGEAFVKSGCLDTVSDVWSLTINDLWEIHHDPSIDVKRRFEERRLAAAKNAHVKKWPKVLTSRGRELRPTPREAKEGEVAGHAVAPGIATGRIKVLHSAREKPFLTGEVLVAKATDPGWTPLFVPAAAIILEIGGALQHGALVAREFGKPCVAGIESVTEKFKDGQLVEVNGTEGIVKLLEDSKE